MATKKTEWHWEMLEHNAFDHLWVDAERIEEVKAVEGVSTVFTASLKGNDQFIVYFDPRYDRAEVRAEVGRLLDSAETNTNQGR